MTPTEQLRDDLQFVRRAVDRQRQAPSPRAILWIWAVYVLIGYTLLDFHERAGGLFLMVAGPICGVLSAVIGRAAARRAGELDRAADRLEFLHWLGVPLAVGAVLALAVIYPVLRSILGGQLIVVAIGLVYYSYGVHRDRHFLWLGPVLIAGGVAVCFVPVYPWTLLGVVIAAGLVTPSLFRRRPGAGQDDVTED